jgi:diguanylate cyclase (GGDEF)-like protein
MSRRASVYVYGVILAAGLMAIAVPHGTRTTPAMWLALAVFTALATITQLFEAVAPGRQSFYVHLVFFFSGMILLSPALYILLVTVPHLVEWAKQRLVNSAHLRAWYIQPFNIAVHVLAGCTGAVVVDLPRLLPEGQRAPVALIATLAAALVYVTINHVLVGFALMLARGISWRDSGILEAQSLINDLVLLCLGGVVAPLWLVNPWLIALALAPLGVMYQALSIPMLKQQAEVDAKTGLANARHFNALFTAELHRTRRFERPLALIMADLDLLRDINNTYGHLAGDAVLAGIGQIIRQTMREYDISGRFGGEEFVLVAPEADPQQAGVLAERLREAVAAARFPLGVGGQPVGVTMSLGVACFPSDGTTAEELVRAADTAVYEAKARGRNRVIQTADLPWERRLPPPPAGGVEERTVAIEFGAPGASTLGVPAPAAVVDTAPAQTPPTAAQATASPRPRRLLLPNILMHLGLHL